MSASPSTCGGRRCAPPPACRRGASAGRSHRRDPATCARSRAPRSSCHARRSGCRRCPNGCRMPAAAAGSSGPGVVALRTDGDPTRCRREGRRAGSLDAVYEPAATGSLGRRGLPAELVELAAQLAEIRLVVQERTLERLVVVGCAIEEHAGDDRLALEVAAVEQWDGVAGQRRDLLVVGGAARGGAFTAGGLTGSTQRRSAPLPSRRPPQTGGLTMSGAGPVAVQARHPHRPRSSRSS